jgi:hypothetical protein
MQQTSREDLRHDEDTPVGVSRGSGRLPSIRAKGDQGLRKLLQSNPGSPTYHSIVRTTHHAGLSDDALVAGLAIEDADAATAFVRRFQAKVFGMALSVTHDQSLADDVAQESFLRAGR